MNIQPAIARDQITDRDTFFARDVITGLSARPKRLPPKYFYDQAGARLFEAITALPEYYPTRSELAILRQHAPEMAGLLPPKTALIEFGSGSTRKARLMLDAAPAVAAYVPVDISAQWLAEEATRLRRDYPRLAVLPVVADFTQHFRLPAALAALPRAGFFPGSTIGNFEPHQATAFLHNAARILGDDAILIVGIDLVKDIATLTAAYNDAAGVTAAFNLNLLARINRELGADFDLTAFSHQAFYNRERARIEMHLASRRDQRVEICGRMIAFRECETIHTENSYKYTVESFGALAHRAGWTPVSTWTDANGYFSVQALRAASGA
ncbi:MAG TPA: L-histidine N(alpha)-methyltransferase [Xanthobacteraceae bacterium]